MSVYTVKLYWGALLESTFSFLEQYSVTLWIEMRSVAYERFSVKDNHQQC